MSDISLNTTIHVDEDTSATLSVRELLAAAGYTTPATLTVDSIITALPNGEYVDTDTPLLGLIDSSTLYVRPGDWQANYNGEFVNYQFVVAGSNGDLISLELRVVIDPVNDAPGAADHCFDLSERNAVVLTEASFGFTDVVEGHGFKSVIVGTLPAAGQVLLDGVGIASGAEVSIADIQAGKLAFVPDDKSGGIVEMGFQVRDDGGLRGAGAQDTSTTHYLRFKVPVPPAPARLGDTVWEDSNANGAQDSGEHGLAGVTVALRDAAGKVVQTTVTDEAGHYAFEVAGGTYTVAVTAPQAYLFSGKHSGDAAVDSDVGADGASDALTLAAGETNDTVDAGLYRNATLASRVWNDANQDGRIDGAEAGVGQVKVTLLDAAGHPIASALTDADGSYAFQDLKPGTYSVQFDAATLPAGMAFSPLGSQIGADGASAPVTLVSGGAASVQAPAVVQTGDIASTVWEDLNANGVQDSGERGIAGATVRLLDASGAQVAVATTDAAGNYHFKAAVGTYSVGVDAPAGHVFTAANAGADDAVDSDVDAAGQSASFDVRANATVDPADAGLYRNANLSSRVWNDANQDGKLDGAEAGVGQVKVTLLDAAGHPVASALTNADGSYSFQDLKPGTYSVQFDAATLPAGMAFSPLGSQIVSDGTTAPVTLASGGEASVQAPAVVQTGKIASTVWEDTNGNGVQDSGESGIAGATVRLLDASGAQVAVATTDAAGNYGFKAAVGNYSVKVDAPTGYTFTAANAGTDDAVDSDVDAAGQSGAFGVSANATVDPADAGLYRAASLGNRVWFDANGDGLQGGTETGIAGVKLVLLDADGRAIPGATTVTDTSGQYMFKGLKPGSYSVQIDKATLPAGYLATVRNAGSDDARDSDFDANGVSQKITLASGESNTSVDAGLTKLATIGDRVWFDADGDGLQDKTEAGVANVAVTLTDAARNVVATTRTDADGNYKFDVTAGTYSVSIQTPAGYGITKQFAGDSRYDSNADASGKLGSVTVAAGDNVTSLDAGLVLGSIGNKVWEDMDFDGVQDSGEAGIGGLTVRLYDAKHVLQASTVTAADGSYQFGALLAGSYSVEVVKPNGYYTTKANATGDGLDSDFSNLGTTNVASSGLIKLAAGEQNNNVDAGLYRKASIGDKVWRDSNHNNVQDAGEAGIGKIKVMLYDASSGALLGSTQTDANGKYLFSNLDPGSYYLKFDKTNVLFTDSGRNTYSMNDWKWGVQNTGSNDLIDSDVKGDGISKVNVTTTSATFLSSGENDMSWDAAITPIAIDLNGDGIQTIARADFHGSFDLLGSGTAIQTGWLSAADAFLAIDSNENGRIDDISELFGGASKGSGFAKLSSFDSNGDGVVNADDAQFGLLQLWQDANSNGITDAGELVSLAQAGVTSLATAFDELPFLDANGNLHLERSGAVVGGQSVSMTDVYFNVAIEDVAAAGLEVTTMASLVGNTDDTHHLYM